MDKAYASREELGAVIPSCVLDFTPGTALMPWPKVLFYSWKEHKTRGIGESRNMDTTLEKC